MSEKIKTLLEALPYIKRFAGSIFVVKYGGAAMEEENLKKEFAKDMVLLKYVGINPVVVHGGGPKINKLLTDLNIPSNFIDGLRVTDEKTLEIAEMVLSGSVNKEIVKNINDMGGKAIGLSGKDGRLLLAKKVKGKDIGLVGEIVGVDVSIIKDIIKHGYIPVIAPIADGLDGKSYNINADTAAGSIAKALSAEKLILLTDVSGVLDKEENLISSLKKSEVEILIKNKTVSGGMIPKVGCCVDAIEGGVEQTHIIDGRIPHAILLEVFTDSGIGTQITGGS
ncbi:MAG TPA: acetylglutamate kinase [Syntrophorhabdus sp.]|jgi:acetylglutamate kinase|nr:acetylglutamate kinase [Syntrophorhabdus sp.]MDI9558339.1 acetylglutamate kinase [Pseudomonadota bacterium]OPX98200.1 MAG: Acetylglutamate kinase [Syntrophorhabdus sp. PtaB.Bin027]OQB78152.1 MAG: Acetylglutamate kinase [Deltaproteobacteria bacterium ADurb.Bin135]MBP8743851.1 acetylglutamate kinase [Syntrophorhabdus sp.]